MDKRGSRRPLNSIDGIARPRVNSRTILDNKDDYLGIGAPASKSSPERKVISLELSVPKIKLPKLPYRRIGYYSAAGLATIFVIGSGVLGAKHFIKKSNDAKASNTKKTQPDFKVVTPLDKPDIAKVQGASATYDPDKHVLSYTDSFFGADFTVSQQPIPENIKNNPNALSNIAANLGSKTSLDTQQGTVYIATNPKTKQQTAVFATNKVLLFIRSSLPVDDTVWKDYINKLNTQ